MCLLTTYPQEDEDMGGNVQGRRDPPQTTPDPTPRPLLVSVCVNSIYVLINYTSTG